MVEINKKNILWQCTVVEFRNGLRGMAINDEVEGSTDGDKVFMVFDNDRRYVCVQRLTNYSDDLKNTLSMKGIMNHLDSGITSGKYQPAKDEDLADSEWDVVKMWTFPYASDAFIKLFR